MLKKIKLSDQTTIVVETVQPAEKLSNEINIYLNSSDDVQDLLLIREKLKQDYNHQVLTLTSDPNTIELLTWADPTDENYTNRTLINKRTTATPCANRAAQLIHYSHGQLNAANINDFTNTVIKTVIDDHSPKRPAEETFDFKTWVKGIEVLGHYETELIDDQAPSLGTRPALITIDALDNQIIE